jgi:hypothetical protein
MDHPLFRSILPWLASYFVAGVGVGVKTGG